MTDFTADDSLGSATQAEIVAYLREIGDTTAANAMLTGGGSGQGMLGWPNSAYLGTDAMIGFIEHGSNNIVPAQSVDAEVDLRGKKLKITFDQFHVEEYPGGGEHRILCEFMGKNQQEGEAEELTFAVTCNARDRQGASVLSLPIFVGIVAGANGISFQGRSVNVRSNLDDTILEVLDSDVFKQGLELIDKVQPAIKPLANLASGVVKMAAKRSNNRQVHHFMLGLDFVGSPTSARLRRGSYIVLQIGRTVGWDWSNYIWDTNTSKLVTASRSVAAPKWNYMVFGVSQYEET
ncbi:hypothetical protein ACN6KF_005409 [Labrys sp. La1]|uniref:hypothetical protein n=1 Tax=Labrys sp. La1 TaxID=3404917 RepID=UPI003EBD0C35